MLWRCLQSLSWRLASSKPHAKRILGTGIAYMGRSCSSNLLTVPDLFGRYICKVCGRVVAYCLDRLSARLQPARAIEVLETPKRPRIYEVEVSDVPANLHIST